MVSWNVRGLNNPRKRLVVKNLLREWKCDVVCLQETKIASIDRQLVCSLWGCPYVDWAVLEADRTVGGILLKWDKRVLDKVEIMCWRIPWCCFRDFNIVRFPSERRGETRLSTAMEKFSEFVEDLNLVDLPLEGGSFTWSSGSDQPMMSRIDRALVTPDWEDHFPDVTQRILPRTVSDHSPILLEAGGMARGKSPFKFENMWLKSEGFVDRVQTWWNRHSFVGTPSFDIVQWNHREFGNVARQKKQLREELITLDAKEGDFGLSDGEKVHRAGLRSQVEHLLSLEEISWRQKSRMLCIKEGDNNTKFFHKMANSHRRSNHLRTLEVDGVVFEEASEATYQVVQFYKNLYKETKEWRPFVEALEFDLIENMERVWLERKFEREEILQVARDLEGDKVPGSDGFTMAFYHHCWKVVEKDVLAFEKSLNATFIALIPKKNDASNIRDFRPISLVGSVYKILARLISENQNSFVGGRQILDSVLIANECVDSRGKSRVPRVICKLDMEKAYDHVNWEALLYLLNRMGFGVKWCKWMRSIISTIQGLRQGDSLSPMLMLRRMEGADLIRGFNLEGRRDDDTILFCDADVEQILHIRLLLLSFQAVTGLKVNVHKSEMVPIGERKLSGWKKLYLSKGGRLLLFKSTLSSLPTYFLSLFTISTHGANKIEKLQRNFLWGDSKIHLVGWDKLWRFGKEEGRLWRRVVASKYGKDWGGMELKAGSICMGWEDFSKNCQFVDGWYGDHPFQLAFPRLYGIAVDKEASVETSFHRQGAEDRRFWNVRFSKFFNDWEMDEGLQFLRILGAITPPMDVGDWMRWKLKPNGAFDIRSYYYKLKNSPSTTFPWKAIWRVKAPRRNKIIMGDNLRLRRLDFVDWCIMCRHCGETVDHLLLHCEMAYRLWSFIDSRLAFWMVELSGEAFVSDLEFSPVVYPMVYLEEAESEDF
ncbi:hypothetical protein ACB092_07G001100 [Castanea dentata]